MISSHVWTQQVGVISIKQPTSLFLDSTHSSESSMDLNTGLWAQRTSLCAWNQDPSFDISSTSPRLGLLMYDARSNSGSAKSIMLGK